MLGAPKKESEKVKQEQYYKKLIQDAWHVVDIDKKGIVDRKEISYIMRYLLQFPSEA